MAMNSEYERHILEARSQGKHAGADFLRRQQLEFQEMVALGIVPELPVKSSELIDSNGAKLTRRQREILGLVALGLTGKSIARRIGISPKTVERHKTLLFQRLGVPNSAAAVARAGIPSKP